jgi:hypothetical protein
MRPAQEIMAQLAGSNLTTEQLALVMELSAAVATEARPVEDRAASRRRKRDREYQAERRQNRPISADVPLKDNSKPLSDPDGSAAKPRDLVKEVFDSGVELLMSQGHTAGRARSLVGKWREGGRRDTDVAAAFIEAKQRGISNLVEWMPKRLNGTGRRGTDPPSYLEHLMSQGAATQ